jgi:hypothetical protein
MAELIGGHEGPRITEACFHVDKLMGYLPFAFLSYSSSG